MLLFLLLAGPWSEARPQLPERPLRVVVAGVSHGHSSWIYGAKKTGAIEVVGIFEPNRQLAAEFKQRNNLPASLFYTDLEHALDTLKPEGVLAFNATSEHLSVVRACAPRGVHVMVEKPLATTEKDARQIAGLAKRYGIQVLTNYETSWYPTTRKTYQLVHDTGFVGQVRKVIFHTGHSGARRQEHIRFFFDWLTHPVKNGGGASFDFGCYGANIMTYLMQGAAPFAVTAVNRQFKPDIYPRVDDESTVILSYQQAQCIIQASWNWPFNRKDMEVYGVAGSIRAHDHTRLSVRSMQDKAERHLLVTKEDTPVYDNPFEFFAAVVRGLVKPDSYSPYTLENNVLVVKILAAARKSARSGKTVSLKY